MATRKLTSTNALNRDVLNNICGMTYAIDILGGRWKLLILYKLEGRSLRFKDLKSKIPGITDRMLTLHLQQLEKDGVIIRSVYAEVPPRVEYHLSESALQLIPIWKQLEKWGDAHKVTMDKDSAKSSVA